jgi:RNA polymerase sigma factor (sigma-70 family)
MTDDLFYENLDLAYRIDRGRQRFLPQDIADDVRSAAMVGLWQASLRWNEESAPFTAYARIRVNGAISDVVRRARWERRGAIETVVDMNEELPETEAQDCVEEIVLERNEIEQVIDRMKQLPVRARTILCRHLQGETGEAIAADYHVSPSAISYILRRTRERLLRKRGPLLRAVHGVTSR